VNGSPVQELYVLLRKPGHLITKESTHEFSKVYFNGEAFNLSEGWNGRCGPQKVKHASFDFVLGLTVELTDYTVHVPAAEVQASWK